jgi:DNA-binding response OmpR family regulator
MAKILVVDDEQSVRELLASILEGSGHEVIQATNGQTAMQLYESCGIDVVLVDLVMPEQEGLETILELRKRHADLPIIAISGAPSALLGFAVDYGASCAFPKPFDATEVLEAVEALVRRAAA